MDFLWECALAPCGKDRAFLIPDGIDLVPPNSSEDLTPETIRCTSAFTIASDEPIRVTVVEEKGEGVVDIIGGTVWEASLLLCGIVMMNPEKFLACNTILELGAGVGLPSLLLAHLRTSSLPCSGSTQLRHVVLTDNDSVLLSNLSVSVHNQFETGATAKDVTAVDLSIVPLDWMLFSNLSSSLPSSPPEQLQLGAGYIVFGSALCYAPIHATLLIGVIRYFLRLGCAEVLVLQISDREGFQHLLTLLKASKELRSSCVAVSQEVYDYAQRVRRQGRSCSMGSTMLYEYSFPAYRSLRENDSPGQTLLRTERECFSILSVTSNAY